MTISVSEIAGKMMGWCPNISSVGTKQVLNFEQPESTRTSDKRPILPLLFFVLKSHVQLLLFLCFLSLISYLLLVNSVTFSPVTLEEHIGKQHLPSTVFYQNQIYLPYKHDVYIFGDFEDSGERWNEYILYLKKEHSGEVFVRSIDSGYYYSYKKKGN